VLAEFGTDSGLRGFNPIELTEKFDDPEFVTFLQSLAMGLYEDRRRR
jgi:hypothetical protein